MQKSSLVFSSLLFARPQLPRLREPGTGYIFCNHGLHFEVTGLSHAATAWQRKNKKSDTTEDFKKIGLQFSKAKGNSQKHISRCLILGAFHYAKDSGNFGWNSNGKVRFGFFWPEYSGSPLEVVHIFRSEYSDRNLPFHFWQTGSLP